MSESLPFAPCRTRPLTWCNPFDCLVFLRWVFYFPQAIRWHISTFHLREKCFGLPGRLFYSIYIISVVCVFLVVSGFLGALYWIPWHSELAPPVTVVVLPSLAGMLLGLWVGVRNSRTHGSAAGVTSGVLAAILCGVAAGATAFLYESPDNGVASATANLEMLALLYFIACLIWTAAGALSAATQAGVALVRYQAFKWVTYFSIPSFVLVSVFVTLQRLLPEMCSNFPSLQTLLAPLVTTHETLRTVDSYLWFCIMPSLVLAIVEFRVDAWCISLPAALLQPSKSMALKLQRVSMIPIPGSTRRLAVKLEENWAQGLHECEGLLRYSLQFLPVIDAVRDVLGRSHQDEILERIVAWCGLGPHDWDAFVYLSEDLVQALGSPGLEGVT